MPNTSVSSLREKIRAAIPDPAKPAAAPAPAAPAATAPNPNPSGAQPRRRKIQRNYLPAVDGLRTLAVGAVLAYHLNLPWAPGGLVGVTTFFVISGFLITGILSAELAEKHTIDLKRFWVRRIRRLFPAIALVLVATALTAWFVNQGLLYKLKTDLLPSLLWVTNWWYIFRQESYFDAMASPSPVLHFWSLSIEEQFYIIWPLIMLFLYKKGARRRGLRKICLVLAIASAAAMFFLYTPGADPSRIYYGTDTRAFSLLAGAYLALRWPVYIRSPRPFDAMCPAAKQQRIKIAGYVSMAGLVLMSCLVSGTDAFWYRGGLALASVFSAVVIAAITIPGSQLGRVFASKPMVWLGTRSYGIYLWHYPILLLMNPSNGGDPSVLKIILEVAIIVGVSELSYRFVEDPLRHGVIGKTIKAYKAGELSGMALKKAVAATATCAVLLASTGVALAVVQNPNQGQGLLTQEDIDAGTNEGTIVADKTATTTDGSGDGDASSNADGENNGDAAATDASQAASAEDENIEITGYEPLMIGDSVSIGLTDEFHQAYTGGLIDACGSRQIEMGQAVYDYYRDLGKVGHTVILALGTNGSFTAEQLEDFIADIGSEREIWIVNNRVPSSWHRTTNQTIASVAANHDNVHVIDWESYSTASDEWIGADGIHLTYAGREAYMQMIVDAIGSNKYIEAATAKANEAAGGAWVKPEEGTSTEMHDALLLGLTPAAEESRKVTGEDLP